MDQKEKRKADQDLGVIFTKEELESRGYRYIELFSRNMPRYQEVEYAGIKCLRDLGPYFRDNSDELPEWFPRPYLAYGKENNG